MPGGTATAPDDLWGSEAVAETGCLWVRGCRQHRNDSETRISSFARGHPAGRSRSQIISHEVFRPSRSRTDGPEASNGQPLVMGNQFNPQTVESGPGRPVVWRAPVRVAAIMKEWQHGQVTVTRGRPAVLFAAADSWTDKLDTCRTGWGAMPEIAGKTGKLCRMGLCQRL